MAVEAPEERFDRLWREHAPAVLRYARRHVGPDDVEDVVAETFVVAWRRLDEIPPFGLPWLLGVARRTSANARRGARRREALTDRVTDGFEVGTWPDLGDHGAVADAVRRLSDADRELLTLIAWDGLSQESAAEALGCTKSALKVRLHRARRRLAALLAQSDADPPPLPASPLPHLSPGRTR